MAEAAEIRALVLGGTGYVAGELLRLLASHPRLRLAAVASSARAGAPVVDCFPHLDGTAPAGMHFATPESLAENVREGETVAVFAAVPHGASAALLDSLLGRVEARGGRAVAVDLGADFRFAEPTVFAAIYGQPHGAPHRCREFLCALPEHATSARPERVAHPGCFTTAVVLAAYPLVALGLCEGGVFVSAVTGSSGSGRTPSAMTHHPERRSALRAYSPLAHRHEREMAALLAQATGGQPPDVEFVPHSGPFVRGIHATVRLTLTGPREAAEVTDAINGFYASTPFVRASTAPPSLTEVVGSNRCRLGVATRGRTAVVTSVIDNLVKGAAGGAVQWMNRMLGLAPDCGLRMAGLGWY